MMRNPAFFLLFLMFFAVLPMAAWAQQSYTVRDVAVEATASDGTTARMEAMTQAESKAFAALMERLLPSAEAESRIAAAKPHEISRMVRGYEIRNEKVSATGYAATLDVNFDGAQVGAFLRPPAPPAQAVGNTALPANVTPPAQPVASGAQLARMRMPNILVLPVWQRGDSTMLWEEQNIWRAAWNHAERSDTHFIRLPIGDQSDQVMTDAEQALTGDFSSLGVIAERYQSSTVIVARAQAGVSSGVNALHVTLRTLGRDGRSGEQPLVYEQYGGESGQELMQRAAQDIIQRVMYTAQQQAMQQQAQQRAAQEQADRAAVQHAAMQHNASQNAQTQQPYMPLAKLTVLSRLQALNDWIGLRQQLLALPMVERVDMAAISSKQVDLVLHYRGSPQQLEAALVQRGIAVQKARNYWIVSL